MILIDDLWGMRLFGSGQTGLHRGLPRGNLHTTQYTGANTQGACTLHMGLYPGGCTLHWSWYRGPMKSSTQAGGLHMVLHRGLHTTGIFKGSAQGAQGSKKRGLHSAHGPTQGPKRGMQHAFQATWHMENLVGMWRISLFRNASFSEKCGWWRTRNGRVNTTENELERVHTTHSRHM